MSTPYMVQSNHVNTDGTEGDIESVRINGVPIFSVSVRAFFPRDKANCPYLQGVGKAGIDGTPVFATKTKPTLLNLKTIRKARPVGLRHCDSHRFISS